MTQALLNNLNITIEKTVNLKDKMPKTEGLDFGKIFESKTNKPNKTTDNTMDLSDNATDLKDNSIDLNDNSLDLSDNSLDLSDNSIDLNDNSLDLSDNSMDLNDNSSMPASQKTNDIQQESDESFSTSKTISNIKDSTYTNENSLTNDIKSNVQEVTAEVIADIPITINEDTNNNTILTEENNENTEDLENAITESAINILEETIITDEEPTMYNEMNTLEDPTTMLILQTQIQKNIKNCFEKEQLDDLTDENINLKTNDSLLNNNTAIFKQLDNAISKDVNVNQTVQVFVQKDTTQVKNTNTKISNVISENIIKELNVEVISAQSSEAEASFGDLMQNQSPQEQAARVMIQGDIKYEQIASETTKSVQVKPTTITPSKIIEQITKQLDGMVNNSKLNMVLNPDFLGKVNLQLMNTKDGLIAQFTVTTQDIKDILMKGLDGLKESLLAQGVNVDNISVKLEEAEGEYKQDYTEQENSKGGNKQQDSKHNKEKGQSFENIIDGIETEENAEV